MTLTGKKKPKRPCFYCGKLQTKLARHLKKLHHSEEAVKAALKKPQAEQNRAFADLRKEGIFEANKKSLKNSSAKFICERNERLNSNDNIVMCGCCRGFYVRSSFHRHKRRCNGAEASSSTVSSIPASLTTIHRTDDEFCTKVLAKFEQDEVGKFCGTDECVIAVGRRLYEKLSQKKSKTTQVRRSTMRDMRRLASIILMFMKTARKQGQSVQTEDIINRKYFAYLREAIVTQTTLDNGSIKPGLKLGLGYILKKLAKVMKVKYLMEDEHAGDIKAKSVDNFLTVLEIEWPSIFGDAEYAVVRSRQDKLRRPEQLPLEEDVTKLRNYTTTKIVELVGDKFSHPASWDVGNYTKLRSVLISRLTLYNARRGGEPSRLLVSEWNDAVNNVWLPLSTIANIEDPAERCLAGKFKIAYQSGKGNSHLVPLLIPADCISAMHIIADSEVRKRAHVLESNQFLFANTKKSNDHMSGWQATEDVCTWAHVSKKITATKMRHRVSTYYASLDVPECDRKFFYSHMGHSASMNANIYQCPLALAEITKVGVHLESLDGKGNNLLLAVLLKQSLLHYYIYYNITKI
jgi:hypothetical protein